MTEAIHLWLAANPIKTELIIGIIVGVVVGVFLLFLTPKLAPVVDVFWKFCAIPPQRLNVWMLKARLASAESKLYPVRRMKEDTHHLIFYCFWAVCHFLAAVLFICLSILLAGLATMVFLVHVAQTVVFFSSLITAVVTLVFVFAAVVGGLNATRAINDAIFGSEATLCALAERVEVLAGRLQLEQQHTK